MHQCDCGKWTFDDRARCADCQREYEELLDSMDGESEEPEPYTRD